jgi:molecular chaperone GrpE
LLNTLEKHGIKQINPVGEKFDPNQHEALFDYPDPKGTPGHVGHVLTVGYKIQERILRPAKVGVVKDTNN